MKKILIICLFALTTSCFSQTINKQRLDSLFQILEKKDKFMGSIAISKNGELLYSKAIGYADVEISKKATTQTKYRIGSISKMFTAVLTLKAVEENKISLDQPLDKFFPQIENSKKITIENLLNHRSGIHNFTNDTTYLEYNTLFKSQKEMIEIIAKGKSDFEPNSKGAYSNSNYVLLSCILEKIYKKNYSAILNEKIVEPLKLKNTYFGSKTSIAGNESYSYKFKNKWIKETETDTSIPLGAGGIISNPTDLTLFIEQLFAGKIISEKSLILMKTLNQKFGLGLFQFPYFEDKNYGHDGSIDGFLSIVIYNPEEKLSVAITSNGTQYPINNILICALSSYFNKPFTIPAFEEIEISSEILNSYLGQYSSPEIPPKITITKNGNNLFAQATGQAAFPLEATTATSFKFESAGIVLEFNADKKAMTLKQGGKEFKFTKE